MKLCVRCGHLLPLGGFARNPKSRDGKAKMCRSCFKDQAVDRRISRRANGGSCRLPNECKICKSILLPSDFSKDRGACKRCVAAKARALRKTQLDPGAARRRYAAKFPERVKAAIAKWRAENPERLAARAILRQERREKRIPKWLTASDWDAIRFIYMLAKCLSDSEGRPYQVDHVLPLCGKFVSGLHVPQNLQILTAEENARKSNIWLPE